MAWRYKGPNNYAATVFDIINRFEKKQADKDLHIKNPGLKPYEN